MNGHNNDGKSYFLMSLSQLVSALTLNPLKSLEFFTSTDNSDNMNACFYTVWKQVEQATVIATEK